MIDSCVSLCHPTAGVPSYCCYRAGRLDRHGQTRGPHILSYPFMTPPHHRWYNAGRLDRHGQQWASTHRRHAVLHYPQSPRVAGWKACRVWKGALASGTQRNEKMNVYVDMKQRATAKVGQHHIHGFNVLSMNREHSRTYVLIVYCVTILDVNTTWLALAERAPMRSTEPCVHTHTYTHTHTCTHARVAQVFKYVCLECFTVCCVTYAAVELVKTIYRT